MNQLFDKLGLTASERRLMIGFIIVLFTMANMWFVWPHFEQWEIVKNEREQDERTIRLYQLSMNNEPKLAAQLAELQSSVGTNALVSDSAGQRLRFESTIDKLANTTTVGIQSRSRISEAKPVGGVTNLFFTELNYPITISTGEKELVDFLYQVGSGDSLIRVRDLSLSPDSRRQSLKGRMTLVAGFRRNPGMATNGVPSRIRRTP